MGILSIISWGLYQGPLISGHYSVGPIAGFGSMLPQDSANIPNAINWY